MPNVLTVIQGLLWKRQKAPVTEVVRYYTKAPGTAYVLPADEEEKQRLKLQHAYSTRALGYMQAPVSLEDDDFVLESGAGTGDWVLEVAERQPKCVQFIGIDIESRLFPTQTLIPSNVQFEVQSILNLPTDWTNKFKYIHQRLLVVALRIAEWDRAIKEIHRVIQPGGWVELVEIDQWVSGPVTDIAQSIFRQVAESRGTVPRPGVGNALKKRLEESGFVNIHIGVHSTPLGEWAGEDGRDCKNSTLSVLRGIKPRVLEAGGFNLVDNGDMYDDLLKRVEEEMNSIPGGRVEWVVAYAQKRSAELS
ncbi:hypothetical protein NP233_g1021 [Leucocoprinus birnbaumii]|uniref:Methyltransferase domain-containing protein n=1 Tax=Leucocoprinus birnbaumii TaxID=56174 RepID=A0AAD5W320_9AGAR|nr:hypothetical protein NP233_g1021 [Leucocoprinus birnbaumii]